MKNPFLLTAAALCLCGCATQSRLAHLEKDSTTASISIADEPILPEVEKKELRRDTLSVTDDDGREILIMRAVQDVDGEMVATDVIRPAVVSARFRNLAERGGMVSIGFDVTVPAGMQDSHWQLRFSPVLTMQGEQQPLDAIYITGAQYRKAQLRGYQQYERFLSHLMADSSKFLNKGQLEIFLRRNLPELYRFREDSSFVSDEDFASVYGVTQRQAVEHYTNKFLIRRHSRRVEMKDAMFRRYVKSPISPEGLRLDSVVVGPNADFTYMYSQAVKTPPRLRKMELSLSGAIYEEDRKLYDMPKCEPLTFYISSLGGLAEMSEKYVTQVVNRQLTANTACYVEFAEGEAGVDAELGHNGEEIGRIKENLRSLITRSELEMDSIVVTASCSPEGSWASNKQLSSERAKAVTEYFRSFVMACTDSVKASYGAVLDLAGTGASTGNEIHFISRSNPENWVMLDALVSRDSVLSEGDRISYLAASRETDPDVREKILASEGYYRYLREKLYPRLRTVRFDFHLHRKGMVQDTIHTTVPDSSYMHGVMAMQEGNYEEAVRILRPYRDINSAIACCAMDFNASAMDILLSLEPSDKVDYMLALVYSRLGDDRNAVQHYLRACRHNRTYISRGNLDPEISVLISRYRLNEEQDFTN